MSKPILTKDPLFHSPPTREALTDWIELHTPAERVTLYTVAGMTWNLAADTIAAAEAKAAEEFDKAEKEFAALEADFNKNQPYFYVIKVEDDGEAEELFGSYSESECVEEIESIVSDDSEPHFIIEVLYSTPIGDVLSKAQKMWEEKTYDY